MALDNWPSTNIYLEKQAEMTKPCKKPKRTAIIPSYANPYSAKPIVLNTSYSAPASCSLSPKVKRKPRAQSKVCKATEETEKTSMFMHGQRDTVSSTDVEEHWEMKFDHIGNPTSMTKHVKKHSQTASKEQIAIEWQQEKSRRQVEMRTLINLKPDEAMGKSYGIKWYAQQLEPLIKLFYTQCRTQELTSGEDGSVWKDHQFILRFLFGLPNQWTSVDTYPNMDGPPWLACCWTMKEMLELCNDPYFILRFVEMDIYKAFAKRNIPKQFIIDSMIMAAYTTGQLLGHCIPGLRGLMRKTVIAEQHAICFPQFHELTGKDEDPVHVRLSYNFELVEGKVPKICAMNCEPQAECFLLGASAECDGPLMQLINDQKIKNRCFSEMEQIIYKEPETYDTRVDKAQQEQLLLM